MDKDKLNKFKEIIEEHEQKLIRLANETLNNLFDYSYESLKEEILEGVIDKKNDIIDMVILFELRAHQTYITYLTFLTALYHNVFNEFKEHLVKKLKEI